MGRIHDENDKTYMPTPLLHLLLPLFLPLVLVFPPVRHAVNNASQCPGQLLALHARTRTKVLPELLRGNMQSVCCFAKEFNGCMGLQSSCAVQQELYRLSRALGVNLEGGLKGFENVVKRTSNGAYRSPRRLAVTKHPMRPPPSSIASL